MWLVPAGIPHSIQGLESGCEFLLVPDLFELIIALASGAAGAIAVISPRVGVALVGVAVATALVPPGYCWRARTFCWGAP